MISTKNKFVSFDVSYQMPKKFVIQYFLALFCKNKILKL